MAGLTSEEKEIFGAEANAFPQRLTVCADDQLGMKARIRHVAPKLFVICMTSQRLSYSEQIPKTWMINRPVRGGISSDKCSTYLEYLEHKVLSLKIDARAKVLAQVPCGSRQAAFYCLFFETVIPKPHEPGFNGSLCGTASCFNALID